MPTVLIADLIEQGVRLDAAEAVAIAQQLIAQLTGAFDLTGPPDTPLLGPPTPANVLLRRDGTVACLGCQVKPSVFEMAVLLQTLLPAGTGQVPGGLRYAIARGLHEVDAPPFDSIDDFSRALARFEHADGAALMRGIVARAAGQTPVHAFGRPRVVSSPAVERRRTTPSATVLRRELHDVDRRLYERGAAAPQAAPIAATPSLPAILPDTPSSPSASLPDTPLSLPVMVPARKSGRWHLPAVAAVLFGAMGLAGVADLVLPRPSSRSPEQPSGAATAPVLRPRDEAGSRELKREPGSPDRIRSDYAAPPKLYAKAERLRYTKRATSQPAAEQEGALVRALDDRHRPVFSPAFASSGTAMFFHTGGTRDPHSALAMATAPEGGGDDFGVMTIVDDGARNYHVQPSPDGRFIAFDSDRDGERGVYIARRDGSNVRRVSGEGYAAVPTWAPDGRRITYVRAEPDNPKVWNLWLQGIDEEQARRLTSYRYGQPWSASWFPDNRRVSYTHEDKLVILDVEGGHVREFSSPIKGALVRTPAVSPDGTKVIFQVYRQGAWILDMADGSMTCVLTDPTAEEFAWAPDGRRVAFHSRRDGQWGIYILHRS